ncbi:hypothetical protein ACSVHC_23005 [Arthrobacter sp. KNU-44]|uniref:hypothetical protein n=1 Tax=unclassified Arthrobacter TaxID=235627 RepID=UPI003F43E558
MGHERAEPGKAMAVLHTLGLSLTASDPMPRGSDYDPAWRDYAETFTPLIGSRDFEFAIKMLADYAAASLKAGRPLLQRSPRLKDPHSSSSTTPSTQAPPSSRNPANSLHKTGA